MKTTARSPQQWQLLRRLLACGCPLDLAHLAPPDAPVRIISLGEELPTHAFQLQSGVGVALCIRIVATSSITVAGFRLTADWLKTPVSWSVECAEHPGKYCLETETGRHVSFRQVLNQRTFDRGRLESGEYVQGFLVGTTSNSLRSAEAELTATLWIRDIFGEEYPHAIKLRSVGA